VPHFRFSLQPIESQLIPKVSNAIPSRNATTPPSIAPIVQLTIRYSYAFKTISAPTPKFATSTFPPLSRRNISRTSSMLYFLVFVDITLTPLLSLSSSCALIQHLAISFCAISTPPGRPAAILPPIHHGLLTRSKEWSRRVRGSAAMFMRCLEA